VEQEEAVARGPQSERVRKHRKALRAAGLRPRRICAPDTRSPGFDATCLEQAARAAAVDAADKDHASVLDAAFDDITRDRDARPGQALPGEPD
jgi:hypothetical protein